MIFNYDKETGALGFNGKNLRNAGSSIKDFFTKKVDIEQPYKLSKGESNFFAKIKNMTPEQLSAINENTGETVAVGLAKDIANDSEALQKYAKITDAGAMSQEGFAQSQGRVIQNTTKFSAAMKSAGGVVKSFIGTLGSMAVMAVASFAIGKIIEGIDYLWNYSDNIIKEGKEASESIESSFKNVTDKQSKISDIGSNIKIDDASAKTTLETLDAIGEKYDELHDGVDQSTNENISLSSEDYQTYLDICNQLAEQSPELVSGYDDQGNAILTLGENAKSSAQNLRELYENSLLASHVEIGKNMDESWKGAKEEVKKYSEAKDEAKENRDKWKEQVKSYDEMRNQSVFVKGASALDQNGQEFFTGDQYDAILVAIQKFNKNNGKSLSASSDSTTTIVEGLNELSQKNIDELNGYYQEEIVELTKDARAAAVAKQEEFNNSYKDAKSSIESVYNRERNNVLEYLKTAPEFAELDKKLQDAITNNISKINLDEIDDKFNSSEITFSDARIINPLQKMSEEGQKAITDFMNKSFSNMTYKQYTEALDKAMKAAFPDDIGAQAQYRNIFGQENEIVKKYERVKKAVNKKGNRGYDQAIDQLSMEDIDYVVQGIDNETIDPIKDTFDQITQAIAKMKKAAAEAKSDTTLSSLLGDTSDEGFSKKVDTFQSDISSLTSTMQSLKTGDFKESDLTDLMQEFPQLVGKTDDLESALSKIKTDKVKSIFKDLDDSLGNATDTELKNAKDFKKELLKSVDFSDVDISNITDTLIDSLSTNSQVAMSGEIASMASNFVSQYKSLITTGLGKSALYKAVLVDPSIITKNQDEVIKAWQDNMPTAKDLIQSDDFQSEISNYQEDFQALYDAQKTLKTGILDGASKKTLFDRFPQLAGHTEDLASAIDDLMDSTKSDALDNFQDKIDALKSAGDIEGANALQDYVNAVISGAEDIENAYQRIANLTIPTPQYAALKEAESTANSGDLYNDLLSQYKTAKEAWQKGEVGTDDFKTFAALISPTGVADAVNFGENSKVFERYFQDTSKGVENFLEDLEKLGVASNESGHWTSTLGNNLDEMKNIAQQMGMGFEPFMMMFGRAEDYGATTDFFTTEEEGQQHLSDLYEQLAEKKRQLYEIQSDPDLAGNQSAIDSLTQDIDELYSRIENTNQAISELPEKAAYYTAENMEQAKDVVAKMVKDIEEATKDGNTELVNKYQSQLDQYLQENGLVYNGKKEKKYISEAERNGIDLRNRPQIKTEDGSVETVYSSSFSNPDETKTVVVTPILPDGTVLTDEELEKAATQYLGNGIDNKHVALRTYEGDDSIQQGEAYSSALHELQSDYYGLGTTEKAKEALEVLKEIDEETLRNIDYTDGAYDANERYERAVDTLCKEWGVGSEYANQLIDALMDMGYINSTPEIDLTTAQDQIDKTTSSLKELQKQGLIDSDIKIGIDLSEATPEELDAQIAAYTKAMNNLDPITYSSQRAELQQSIDVMNQQSATLKVKAKLDEGSDVEELLKLNDEELSARLGIDVTNEAQLAAAKEDLQYFKENGTVDSTLVMKLDETQFKQLTGDGQTSTITIDGNNQTAKESADEAVKYADKKSGTVVINGNKEPAETATNEAVDYINSKSASITVNAKTDTLVSDINQALNNQDFHVNVTANVNTNVTGGTNGSASGGSSGSKSSDGKASSASGTFTSIAHACGTAYNVLNYSPAHADGNIALSSDESALVNEVGTESIVRQGRWMLIPGGAHFQSLKKGDIIFNHQQTQELLNSGRVMSGGGHARAYAKGTLSIPAHASIGKAHSSTPLANWNKNRTQVGNTSANTNAEKANTDSKKKNTNETNKNTTAVKKSKTTFDWVEKRITYWGDKVKAIADKINDYINKSLKQSRLSAQMKQMEYQIGSNEKGQRKYMQKANSVANSYTYYDDKGNAVKTSVSKYYQKLVQKGSYKVEDMDTSTTNGKALVEAINEYQKWYEKAKNCGQAITDLRNEQMQLFEQWANMPTEKATDALEKIQKGFAGIEATENRLNAVTSGGSTQKAMVDAMTSAANKQASKTSKSKTAYDKAKTTADKKQEVLSQKQATLASAKGLTNSQKEAIAQGKYVDPNKVKNKTTKAIVKQYNSARTAYAKAKDKKSTAKAQYKTNKDMSTSMNSTLAEARAGYDSGNELSYMNSLVDAGVVNKQQTAQEYNKAWVETINNKNKYQSEYDKYWSAKDTYSKLKNEGGKKIAKDYASKLTSAQKSALKAGKTVSTKGVTDKTLLKSLKEYNNAIKKLPEATQNYARAKQQLNIVTKAEAEAATNAANAETEASQAQVDAVKTKFENAKNYYEGLLGYQEQLGNLSEKGIDLSNAHGNYEKTSDYDTKISNVQASKAIKQQEIDSLTNELNQGVANGTIVEGSQEWIDMKTQILEAQNAVGDYDTKIEELKQQQIGVYYEEQFTRAIDKIEQFKDKLDTLKGIITDDMKIDKNTGLLTEMGALSLTMNRDQFRSNNEELAKLFAERNQIEADFKADKFGEKDYDSKMKEVQSSINNIISSNSSLQQEALTLVKNQAQAELDVLNKVIDKRKEALKAKKDYYDYDKTLKDQTKDIQLLERQIAALEGSTNAEDKARKARLQEQLSDAKDKRNDTIVEHAYSLQTDSLDKLSSDMSEDFEKWSNTISSNIEEMSKAINEAITNAGQSTSQVMTNLSTILRNVGLTDDQISQVTQGISGSYASGTDYVNKSGVYRINENGMELINSKKYGLLTYLNQGDSVIDANMSKRILENAASATSNNFPVLQKAAQDIAQAINMYNTNQSLSPIMNVTINIDGANDPASVGQEVRKQLNAYSKQMKKDFFTLR